MRKVLIKLIGKEVVEVKAGKFEASVYEKKTAYSKTDNNGGGSTSIATIYLVKDIGVVKSVNLSITKHRKAKSPVKSSAKQRKDRDIAIEKAVEDLKEGKDISEIAFFKDSTRYRTNDKIETVEFEVRKVLFVTELVSYTLK